MKYTMDSALSELQKRSSRIRRRRSKRVLYELSTAVFMLTLALITSLSMVIPDGASALTGSDYGAFLLPADAGGYVLVGVISFVAAVVITVIFLRRTDKRSRNGRKNEVE